MNKESTFIYIWRGWTITVTVLFMPILVTFTILVPEQRGEMWPAIFVLPAIAALQGILVAGGVIFGNKLWLLKGATRKIKT